MHTTQINGDVYSAYYVRSTTNCAFRSHKRLLLLQDRNNLVNLFKSNVERTVIIFVLLFHGSDGMSVELRHSKHLPLSIDIGSEVGSPRKNASLVIYPIIVVRLHENTHNVRKF